MLPDVSEEEIEKLESTIRHFTTEISEFEEKFDYKQFATEVEELMGKVEKDEIQDLKDEDYEELVNYLLASNERIDTLLQKIEDQEKLEIAVDSLKTELDEILDNTSDYGAIQDNLNGLLDDIEEGQREKGLRGESPFVLRGPKMLEPRQEYSYQVVDLLSHGQSDWFFFEFSSVTPDFQNYEFFNQEDGFV